MKKVLAIIAGIALVVIGVVAFSCIGIEDVEAVTTTSTSLLYYVC